MKKIILGFLLIILLLSACKLQKQGSDFSLGEDRIVNQILKSVEINIKSPNPYPEGNEERGVVWKHVLDINHEEADAFHLRFGYLNVIGWYTQDMYYEKNFGECDLNAPEGFTRELINGNTIIEKEIAQKPEDGVYSLGSLTKIPCKIHTFTKQILCHNCPIPDDSAGYITYQELYEQADKYIDGDFVVFKDENDNVLSIYFQSPSESSNIREVMLAFDMAQKVNIELHSKRDNINRFSSSSINEFGEIIKRGEMLGNGIYLQSIEYIKRNINNYQFFPAERTFLE